jgi:hypothetical protein
MKPGDRYKFSLKYNPNDWFIWEVTSDRKSVVIETSTGDDCTNAPTSDWDRGPNDTFLGNFSKGNTFIDLYTKLAS